MFGVLCGHPMWRYTFVTLSFESKHKKAVNKSNTLWRHRDYIFDPKWKKHNIFFDSCFSSFLFWKTNNSPKFAKSQIPLVCRWFTNLILVAMIFHLAILVRQLYWMKSNTVRADIYELYKHLHAVGALVWRIAHHSDRRKAWFFSSSIFFALFVPVFLPIDVHGSSFALSFDRSTHK